MQSRFAIMLMSVAGAGALFGLGFLFGLGVLSSPPPEHHKQIALTTEPTRVSPPETTGSAAHGGDQALTPIYPAAPAGPQAPLATQPQKNEQERTAKVEPSGAPAPKDATPVSLRHRKACDVDACSRAYRSFRAADCTYQPYSGPRQLCVDPPAATDTSRAADHVAHVRVHRGGSVEDEVVTREAGRMTDGRGSDDGRVVRRYRRDFTADGEDDRVVPADVDRGDWADDDDQ
jgi:hypothetical protein